MIEHILKLPVFLIFIIIALISMYIPAIHALTQDAFHVARSFFYLDRHRAVGASVA